MGLRVQGLGFVAVFFAAGFGDSGFGVGKLSAAAAFTVVSRVFVLGIVASGMAFPCRGRRVRFRTFRAPAFRV